VAAPKVSVGPKDFELLCVIGQGAFGKVCSHRYLRCSEDGRH
jgi:hypothetical protein